MEVKLTIEIENLAPANGTLLTPVWFGIHNGTFDTYDRGRPVSPGLESLAEDGAVDIDIIASLIWQGLARCKARF